MRDWTMMREKVAHEGACRVGGRVCGPPEAAHIIPRSRVRYGGEGAENCVPLCREHHALYDTSSLDILPYLTREEQAYAVALVGLVEAYRYVTNQRPN